MNPLRAALLALLTVLAVSSFVTPAAAAWGADYTVWVDSSQPPLSTHGEGGAWLLSDEWIASLGYGYSQRASGMVSGDYGDDNLDPTVDRYYQAPRKYFDGSELTYADAMGADYTIWADGFGTSDYAGDSSHYVSAVPEPSSIVLGSLALAGTLLVGLRRRAAR